MCAVCANGSGIKVFAFKNTKKKKNNNKNVIYYAQSPNYGCSAHVIAMYHWLLVTCLFGLSRQWSLATQLKLIEWIHSRPLNVSILSESRKSNENVYFQNVYIYRIWYLSIKSANLLLFSHKLCANSRFRVFVYSFLVNASASGDISV